MSTNPITEFSYSPAIQAVIPLIYAAWADQVLSPSEVSILKQKASFLTFLSPEDILMLEKWTDPAHPPGRDLFKYWEIVLKKAIQENDIPSGKSLVDVGLAMAERAAKDQVSQEPFWKEPAIRKVLEEVEAMLGLINQDTYLSLFGDDTPAGTAGYKEYAIGFDVADLTALLDDEYAATRQQMRNLLQDPVFAYQTLRDKEAYRDQVLTWTQLLAEQGLGAISYPEAYGGKDDMGNYAAVFEMLGYHDLSLTIKFGVQFGLFGGSVMWLGTKTHHDLYLADIGTGKLLGCFAMTETGHGSNVRGLETTATYDKETDSFIIDSPNREAGKEYIGNAMHGRMASVFAQLIVNGENHGVHALLVPLRDENNNLLEGIAIEDCGYKVGLNGVDNGRIWFDKVRVPRINLLNRFGEVSEDGMYTSSIENPSRRFFTMLGTLVGGRVCVPRAGLSAAKSGLTIAIKYALRRRQFAAKFNETERLILDYPTHQRRLMPLLAKAYALDFALTYLTKRYVNRSEEDIREIETLAAGLKSYATWFTSATLQECREACGGKGYLAENRFADLRADSDIFTTFEGDNTVLMQLVAKGVLSAFQKEFHEEGVWGMLRYVGDRVSTAITEMNPLTMRNTDPEHLRDRDFQLNAFKYRERKMLYSVAQRLRGWIKEGVSSYEAFLKCQTHMVDMAEAFIEYIILEQFVKTVEGVADEGLKQVLDRLCDLYALHTIEKHKGWYLEHDYLAGVKTKAIRRMVDTLCEEVRRDAAPLVEAFAIPDSCLGAQIIQ